MSRTDKEWKEIEKAGGNVSHRCHNAGTIVVQCTLQHPHEDRDHEADMRDDPLIRFMWRNKQRRR